MCDILSVEHGVRSRNIVLFVGCDICELLQHGLVSGLHSCNLVRSSGCNICVFLQPCLFKWLQQMCIP
eukprot:7197538-Prorocentrum_lima.AAC.1